MTMTRALVIASILLAAYAITWHVCAALDRWLGIRR